MYRLASCLAAVALSAVSATALANETTVTMHEVSADGVGAAIGTITFVDTGSGLLVEPALSGAAPGLHGTHVHQNPDCGAAEANGSMVPAGAAGGHYDPAATGQHLGPYGDGHLGDLPNLAVEPDGTATVPMLAPRVAVADLKGRSIVMHAAADRYDDQDMGGARMYCGVFE